MYAFKDIKTLNKPKFFNEVCYLRHGISEEVGVGYTQVGIWSETILGVFPSGIGVYIK